MRAGEHKSMRAESEGRRTGEQDVGEHVIFGRIKRKRKEHEETKG
jgi:hypothetical protein